MLTCKQLTELVTDFLEGRLSFRQRLAVHGHLGMCGHCRAYLRQMKVTVKTLGRLPAEAMPAKVREDLMARFRNMQPRSEAPQVVPASVRLLSTLERMLGGRRGWIVAGTAFVIALILSSSFGLQTGAVGEGSHCLVMECAAGMLPALLLGLTAFAKKARLSTGALLAPATVGGLAAFLMLQATCPASHLAQHVLVFHLGGMAVAALAAVAAARLPSFR